MEPFFFGDTGRKLFAIYHPPFQEIRSTGILICAPLFHEYIRANHTLRQIALSLSQANYSVLRFDYFATGNSQGELADVAAGQWIDDINRAIDEFQAISGVRQIAIVGVRLGALLAINATAQRKNISRYVIWDGIFNGADYLAELEATHQQMIEAHRNLSAKQKQAATHDEFLGSLRNPVLLDEIKTMQLENSDKLENRTVLISTATKDLETLPAAQRHTVDFPCGWDKVTSQVLYAHDIVQIVSGSF
jgi:esterase/lipase